MSPVSTQVQGNTKSSGKVIKRKLGNQKKTSRMRRTWRGGARDELNEALDKLHEELIHVKMQIQANNGMARQTCQRMDDKCERLGAALLM